MKKDVVYIIGGLAVGAVVFYALKDKILKKKRNAGVAELPTPIDDVDSGAPAQGGGSEAPASSAPPASQGSLPYASAPIRPDLLETPAYQQMFGGCSFPIVDGSSSPCVSRLQGALGVNESGTFDMATQEALDDYIEEIPNRSQGYFSGFSREGCISLDPASGTESNLCGLNHDQYLDILFKMGINPLTGE